MIEQVSTERLVMRKFNKNDYQDIAEYLCDESIVYALVEKSGGKVIGHVIFHPYEYENVYEIGWIINKDYQGRGLF